ncbi:MAG: hypothetical protein RR063_10090 [Anaerovoracaceae bacterium]
MEQLKEFLENIPPQVLGELTEQVQLSLNKCGLFYRIFSREKTYKSASEKIAQKGYCAERQMQDLFGVRVVLYFREDIDICREILTKKFCVIEEVCDPVEKEVFKPTRLNLVCALPASRALGGISWPEGVFIDKTFELQIRTVLSEGWHEVEHDLRYKCKSEWEGEDDLWRALNGVFATLETCDWSISAILDDMAYTKYKNHSWLSMIRNKFRIRLTDSAIRPELLQVLNESKETAKKIFRADRSSLLIFLALEITVSIPITGDNLIYLLNYLHLKDDQITALTPPALYKQLDKYTRDSKE